MPKFNPAKYDPATDSSPGTAKYRTGGAPATVILDWTSLTHAPAQPGDAPTVTKVCPCGCRELLGSKSKFRMGHDARLKGKLTRAHVTGTDITIVKGNDMSVTTAVALASQFTSPAMDWVRALRDAEKRHKDIQDAKIARANKQVVATAKGPQVGTRKLVKVGRWNYTGQIVAVYEDKGLAVFEYVTTKGETKTVERPLDDVAAMADPEA